MTPDDIFVVRLTAWRENRGGGYAGMQSVVNVILNRAQKRASTPYAECIRPLQFSSLTARGDPELGLWPMPTDPEWKIAASIVQDAADGKLDDITGGATMYYNPEGIVSHLTIALPDGETIKWPQGWNQNAVTFTKAIAGHYFFK